MKNQLHRLIGDARQAIQTKNWRQAQHLCREIIQIFPDNAEGHFIYGIASKASGDIETAISQFKKSLALEENRYDAAIELANLYFIQQKHDQSLLLLEQYESHISKNPTLLDMAGVTFERLGLHERALRCFAAACDLQPTTPIFQEHLASSKVNNGDVDEAISIYEALLKKYPRHQRNHYELSRIRQAKDESHILEMKALAEGLGNQPSRTVFLNYAIGKELEDLNQWEEAFDYYRLAGDAATKASRYDVTKDQEIIQNIMETCDAQWLSNSPVKKPRTGNNSTPIFIVGLPRSGTTLLERCLSNHSAVESAGETFFMQKALFEVSQTQERHLSPAVIKDAAEAPPEIIGEAYLKFIKYRLSGTSYFIDKLPENYFNLGFIAKSMPDSKIILMNRNPMDSCFAQYKQSYFRYAYNLKDLGEYYIAYNNLINHWRDVLGDRIIEVDYEDLVIDNKKVMQETLESLGLDFEIGCTHPEKNTSPVSTASSAQVVEKVHSRSINKWRNFQAQLRPLERRLREADISTS